MDTQGINNTAPEYLCDLIKLNVQGTTIRTRASFDPCLLCVPPISKTCAHSFFDRSFVYAAPTNFIPVVNKGLARCIIPYDLGGVSLTLLLCSSDGSNIEGSMYES